MGVVKLSKSEITDYEKYSSMLAGNPYFLPISYDLLESTTLSSSVGSITFSNLLNYSDYKHLQLVVSVRGTDAISSTGHLYIRFNGITSSSYSSHTFNGRGDIMRSAANSSWDAILNNVAIPLGSSNSNFYSASVLDFYDFKNSAINPTVKTFSGVNIDDPYLILASGMLVSTAAINSITLAGWTMAVGSRFSLYGLKG